MFIILYILYSSLQSPLHYLFPQDLTRDFISKIDFSINSMITFLEIWYCYCRVPFLNLVVITIYPNIFCLLCLKILEKKKCQEIVNKLLFSLMNRYIHYTPAYLIDDRKCDWTWLLSIWNQNRTTEWHGLLSIYRSLIQLQCELKSFWRKNNLLFMKSCAFCGIINLLHCVMLY